MKEAFVISAGLSSLHKLLSSLQQKLSEEDWDLIQYKDNKLTYFLKNLLKQDSKVAIISHINILESNFEEALKTLEISQRFALLDNFAGSNNSQGKGMGVRNRISKRNNPLMLTC